MSLLQSIIKVGGINMFSEEHFLKLAGFQNPLKDDSHFHEKYFETDDIAKIVSLLMDSVDIAPSLQVWANQIAKDQKQAISYLEENVAEALLSNEPFVRAYAEAVYKRNQVISQKKNIDHHHKWFKKKGGDK